MCVEGGIHGIIIVTTGILRDVQGHTRSLRAIAADIATKSESPLTPSHPHTLLTCEGGRVHEDQCVLRPRGEGRGRVAFVLIVIVTDVVQRAIGGRLGSTTTAARR